MITVLQEKKTSVVRNLLEQYKFFEKGHYCYNIDLISEVKDGWYRLRNIMYRNKICYYIVYNDEQPILIAPLEFNKKTITLVGVNEGFDYVDMFYRDDVDASILYHCFQELLNSLKIQGFNTLVWNFLPHDSKMKAILNQESNKEIDGVSIQFLDYSTLLKDLSKSTRQNLRTAENRLIKDKKKYRLITSYLKPFSQIQKKRCIEIYYLRQKNKYAKGLLNRLMIKTINYNTQMMRKNKGLFTALEIDANIVAFMFGYVNEKKHSFEVPKLAVDDTFGFYSPGMILVSKTLEFLAENTEIRSLDLCRGTEQYKIKMGGKVYKNYNYTIQI